MPDAAKANTAIRRTSAIYCPRIFPLFIPNERNTPVSCTLVFPHNVKIRAKMIMLTAIMPISRHLTSPSKLLSETAAL